MPWPGPACSDPGRPLQAQHQARHHLGQQERPSDARGGGPAPFEYLDGGMDLDRAVAARAELTVHRWHHSRPPSRWIGARLRSILRVPIQPRSSTLSDLRTRLRRVQQVQQAKGHRWSRFDASLRRAAFCGTALAKAGSGTGQGTNDSSCDDRKMARWMPLSTAKRQELVVRRLAGKWTIPLMPDDFEWLLRKCSKQRAALADDRDALGYFDGCARARSASSMSMKAETFTSAAEEGCSAPQSGAEKEDDPLVRPEGSARRSLRVAQLFRSGRMTAFPKAVKNQIDKGPSATATGRFIDYAQIIKRYKPWQELVKDIQDCDRMDCGMVGAMARP